MGYDLVTHFFPPETGVASVARLVFRLGQRGEKRGGRGDDG